MTTQEKIEVLRKLAGGLIFHASFIKRTTGERREMQCRLGVTQGVNGEGAKYDFAEKGLIPVFDIEKQAWRSIPLDSEDLKLTIQGITYQLNPSEKKGKKGRLKI